MKPQEEIGKESKIRIAEVTVNIFDDDNTKNKEEGRSRVRGNSEFQIISLLNKTNLRQNCETNFQEKYNSSFK